MYNFFIKRMQRIFKCDDMQTLIHFTTTDAIFVDFVSFRGKEGGNIKF